MATSTGEQQQQQQQDALVLFRSSIASKSSPIPTTSDDPSSTTDAADLKSATHILFNLSSASTGAQHIALAATTPTRFVSASHGALDLLSVYWCWTNKDKGAGEYISSTQALNADRSANGLSAVVNLVFAEKLDLVNWLAGDVGEAESEFITPLGQGEESRRLADDAAALVKGDGDVVMGDAGASDSVALRGARKGEDERLRAIYAQERKLGDRNTVLRGIKPTDFSHVRKYTALFLNQRKPNGASATPALVPAPRAAPGKPGRKVEPIILLSPSASSLLRLSNVKSFLVDGLYTPPTSSSNNMLQISRMLPSIDPVRPTRFILVESPENFKPDYWNRVVAVFTTGQAWQFKGYKWSNPADLFSKVMGIYVGWTNEGVPEAVKNWGRGVLPVGVEYYRDGQTANMRWRDREVVEQIWSAIEGSMRAKGFARER